jgi:hypothetical protein
MDHMKELKSAYLRLLSFGILAIRDYGKILPGYAEIEADHLHNLPRYASDEARWSVHRYYFNGERGLYIERMTMNGLLFRQELSFTINRYRDMWGIIEEIITAQQVDSAEASTIAVPPFGPSGSPR